KIKNPSGNPASLFALHDERPLTVLNRPNGGPGGAPCPMLLDDRPGRTVAAPCAGWRLEEQRSATTGAAPLGGFGNKDGARCLHGEQSLRHGGMKPGHGCGFLPQGQGENLMLSTWLARSIKSKRRSSRPSFVPRLELLENRTAPAVLTVNSLADAPVDLTDTTVTLRDAIYAANNDLPVSPGGPTASGADEIRFESGLTGTISLVKGE